MKITEFLNNDVAVNLVDERHITWLAEELYIYYLAAISFVVSNRPDAYTQTQDFTCEAGTYQQVPNDSLRLVDVVCNKLTGRPIQSIGRDVLDRRFDWYSPSSSDLTDHPENYIYDDRSPREFYLYPGVKPGVAIRAIFSKLPESPIITNLDDDEALIPLNDSYLEPIRFYIMYRAFMKEAESQDVAKATSYLQSANAYLGIKTNSDAGISPNNRGQ